MNDKNSNNLLIIFGISLILLIANSYMPEGVEIFGLEIKQVDFLGDIRTDDFYDDDSYEDEEYEEDEYFEGEDDEYFEDNESENDTSFLEGKPRYNLAAIINFNIFTEFVVSEIDKLSNNYILPSQKKRGGNLSGNLKQLNKFFSALKKTKNKQVRIAHYGDSTLEGDLISADLRELFQKKFGGNGVGLLPITSHDAKFRKTTDLSFSDDWITETVFSRNKDRLPVGINGQVFVNSDGSWVKMKTNNRYKTVRKFDVAKLFYSKAKSNAKIKYILNGKKGVTKSLSAGKGLKVLEIKNKGSKSIKIEFPRSESAYYYGVSLESKSGVFVDNYALRGNSGVDLKKISNEYLKDFQKEMDYKLIILEFGLNILSGRKTNFTKYERDMVKIINKMKKAMPDASFLLVGVHDKCIKKGSKFITDPTVLKLIKAQKSIADKADIAFWNLFEAMGGENSMVEWVNANPPRAFKDYIHFNDIGAKKEAEMLFAELMKKYK
ncbi:MAG: GDSL-type esterase/lipase family protein [Melioribacteraceae bacterium]|nr:GDSL-type esterase/lipase family protein [Melioribacteraceae bacterium]